MEDARTNEEMRISVEDVTGRGRCIYPDDDDVIEMTINPSHSAETISIKDAASLVKDTMSVSQVDLLNATSASLNPDTLGGSNPIYDDRVPPKNMYVAARGHVQRVIDVALLISNMSRLADITKRRGEYSDAAFGVLVATLVVSILAQCGAGVLFFIAHQKEINGEKQSRKIDYLCYACVGAIMILNVFIATFDISWSSPAPA